MHAYDFDAVVYDCDVYCLACLPDDLTADSRDEWDEPIVHPIFADSEHDSYPVCCNCGAEHDYVSLTPEGEDYEMERREQPGPDVMRWYKRFRDAGRTAEDALDSARTLARWDEAEQTGSVRIVARPDPDSSPSDWHDTKGGACECEDCRAYARDGAWGTVGEYRTDPDSEDWTHADSVWGHVGYNDVLSPLENPYVVDIMAATLDALDAQAIAPGL
jgi:hypothetical protein